MMYGIDISEHNGNINLAPYRGQFVIIRAGLGRSRVDYKLDRNVRECNRLGIPYGFYWYSYALNVEQAKAEADKCLEAIKPYRDKLKVGVWFDMEDADHYKARNGFKFNRNSVSGLCNAFCEKIERAGYYAGIYTSQSWLGTYVDCPKYDKWVASWGVNDGKVNRNTSKLGTILQYTSVPLDKDLMYADISRYTVGEKKPDEEPKKPEKEILEVDGWFGTKTIRRSQEFFGTLQDGIISNQPQVNKHFLPTAVAPYWEFKQEGYQAGSQMIRRLQEMIGATQDGWCGAECVQQLQRFLAVSATGFLNETTTKAWQTYLNNH